MTSELPAVEVVHTLDSFYRLKSEWDSLLEKSASDSFFLKWTWIITWWEHYGADRALYVIVVRDSDREIIGIAPFYIDEKWQNFPIKALTLIGSSPISSEYLDIIAKPGEEDLVSKTVVTQIIADHSVWDCLFLADVLESSICYSSLKKRLETLGFKSSPSLIEICPYLNLPDTPAELFAGLDSRLRSTIKRKLKKLDQEGVEFVTVDDFDQLPVEMLNLFNLHQRRWGTIGAPGNLRDSVARSFHSTVASRLFPENCLRLYMLKARGETIAVLYAYQYNQTIYYFQSGFHPEWVAYSPGTVLMWKVIENAVSEKLKIFDFLRGNEPYKQLWTGSKQNTYKVAIYRKTNIRMSALVFTQGLKFWAKERVRSLLNLLSASGNKKIKWF